MSTHLHISFGRPTVLFTFTFYYARGGALSNIAIRPSVRPSVCHMP